MKDYKDINILIKIENLIERNEESIASLKDLRKILVEHFDVGKEYFEEKEKWEKIFRERREKKKI